MTSVAIVYFSQTGTTRQLAEAISTGVLSVAESASHLISIKGAQIEQGRFVEESVLQLVDESDAVIFGSPTYMGGPAAQFKAFADASSDRWDQQKWADKLAAGFTIGSNAGGDQLSTLQYFTVLAAQHGMMWLGLDMPENVAQRRQNLQGTQLGLSVHAAGGTVQPEDILTAEYLGVRVAQASRKLFHK